MENTIKNDRIAERHSKERTQMNLLGEISIRYSNMTIAEKKIANVILSEPNKAMHFTVTDMANQAGVSRGSIINFATSLGYSGYTQLRTDLGKQCRRENDEKWVAVDDEAKAVFQKVMDMTVSAMYYTIDVMSKKMRVASEMLIAADKILIFAAAPSAYVAEEIGYTFMRIGLPVVVSSEPIVATLHANRLTEKSVLIEVSEGGRTRTGIEVARTAKNNQAKLITFTSTYDSPLYKISDVALVAVGKNLSMHLDASIARTLYMIMGECICTYITSKIGDEAFNRLSQELAAIEKFRESK